MTRALPFSRLPLFLFFLPLSLLSLHCGSEYPCSNHDDCLSAYCFGGFCKPRVSCLKDDDCPFDQSCEPFSRLCATCPNNCFKHGSCSSGSCSCHSGYSGSACDGCASGFAGYPDCQPLRSCPGNCSGRGSCNSSSGVCSCKAGYSGLACDACASGYVGYPNCTPCTATVCGNQCVNLSTHPQHCGSCDHACVRGQTCLSDLCQVPAPGTQQIFTAGGVTFAMRYIPAGFFLMGSPTDDPEAYTDEKPQRRVTITRGFWMLETEVTQGQYASLVGPNPSSFSSCGGSCPVESVSWDDALAFADKLSAAQGLAPCTSTDIGIFRCQGWRLPTEAEWEYAARAGTTTPRYGNLGEIAWYFANSGSKSHPVGEKQANAWGLYDMLGNVWEWTLDLYDTYYAGLPTSDPLRAAGGTLRVSRGGSWDSDAKGVRSALRFRDAPTNRYNVIGFRVLRY